MVGFDAAHRLNRAKKSSAHLLLLLSFVAPCVTGCGVDEVFSLSLPPAPSLPPPPECKFEVGAIDPAKKMRCTDAPGGFTDCFPLMGIDVGPTTWTHKVGPDNAAAISDCDGDGLPDAFSFSMNTPGKMLRNLGGFTFEDITVAAGLPDKVTNAAAFGDLDNDGLPDLVLAMGLDSYMEYKGPESGTLYSEVRVYHNQGKCHFEDVSTAWGFGSRISDTTSFLTSVTLADMNLDGRLDVLLSRATSPASTVWGYVSQPDDTWTDVGTDLFGPAAGSGWGNYLSDIDDDGYADVFMFFDGRSGPPADFFHRVAKPGPLAYVEADFDSRILGPKADPASLMFGMAAEVDGDGAIDQYIGDIGPSHLYVHRDGKLVDVGLEVGAAAPTLPDGSPNVAYAGSFADFDNDMWPDIVIVAGVDDGFDHPARAVQLHNRGDGTFEDMTPLLRQEEPHQEQWVTASDIDRDGHLDYWFGGEAEAPRILRNQVPGGKSFALRLRGHTSNAEGVGARVSVWVGERKQMLEMGGGGMMWGYGESRLVFGLGCAAAADAVEVVWPDGYVQRAGPFAADTEAVIEEPDLLRVEPIVSGQGAPVKVTVKPAKIDGTPLGKGHAITITMDPGDLALPVSDEGDGSYIATAKALAKGLYGVTVRIDGKPLLARPQVLVH